MQCRNGHTVHVACVSNAVVEACPLCSQYYPIADVLNLSVAAWEDASSPCEQDREFRHLARRFNSLVTLTSRIAGNETTMLGQVLTVLTPYASDTHTLSRWLNQVRLAVGNLDVRSRTDEFGALTQAIFAKHQAYAKMTARHGQNWTLGDLRG